MRKNKELTVGGVLLASRFCRAVNQTLTSRGQISVMVRSART